MLPCPTSRISLGEPSSVMRGFHRDAGSNVSICKQTNDVNNCSILTFSLEMTRTLCHLRSVGSWTSSRIDMQSRIDKCLSQLWLSVDDCEGLSVWKIEVGLGMLQCGSDHGLSLLGWRVSHCLGLLLSCAAFVIVTN